MRILLAEDDKVLGESLKKALEKHAYGVDWVQDGDMARQSIEDFVFSAVVLDVNLPKMSGIEVLQEIRKSHHKVPVLILTARDRAAHKVEALDNGADDYLVKPFDLDELMARLRALIRRSEGRHETMLVSGDITLDPTGSTVKKNGAAVTLTAKEFRILKLLMERAEKYTTKSDIEYAFYDVENMAESNTIEVAIYNLRKKLGADFIKSIRGVGYMVHK